MSDPTLLKILKDENEALKTKFARMKRKYDHMSDLVEKFVTRKTINDFPIDDSIQSSAFSAQHAEGFDFRFYKRGNRQFERSGAKTRTTNNQ